MVEMKQTIADFLIKKLPFEQIEMKFIPPNSTVSIFVEKLKSGECIHFEMCYEEIKQLRDWLDTVIKRREFNDGARETSQNSS